MLIDAVDKFLLKHISDKGIAALYDRYLSIVKINNNLICEQSIPYLKKFVNHSPFECICIIRAKENNLFTLLPWGEEYVHLLSLIAAYHLDRNEITEGVLWADKAIDMIDHLPLP
ncbi:MAG: hypothetical protein IPJ26_15945 [Bacteroidetes bacterium]|nr:hypothetical protein [Bacteroidota bacterium]